MASLTSPGDTVRVGDYDCYNVYTSVNTRTITAASTWLLLIVPVAALLGVLLAFVIFSVRVPPLLAKGACVHERVCAIARIIHKRNWLKFINYEHTARAVNVYSIRLHRICFGRN